MLFLLVVALLAVSAMAGSWFGRLQERATWTRRLLERGINPNTLIPRSGGVSQAAVDRVESMVPLSPDADAMRDAMEAMSREVERLAEGQRFLTEVLSEKRATTSQPPRPDEPPGS